MRPIFAYLRCLILFFILFNSLVSRSQEQSNIEVSMQVLSFYILDVGELPAFDEPSLYYPFYINYNVNQKLSVGINIVTGVMYLNMANKDFYRESKDSAYLQQYYSQQSDYYFDQTEEIFTTGYGINVKYNYLTLIKFKAFIQGHVNYMTFSTFDVGDYNSYDENGNVTSYVVPKSPYDGHTAINLNVSAGMEFKLNRHVGLYFQTQFLDLLDNNELLYSRNEYRTNNQSGYSSVDKVEYVEDPSGETNSRISFDIGLRINILNKKIN